MYYELDNVVNVPIRNLTISRYFDTEKSFDFIDNERIFFKRVDTFKTSDEIIFSKSDESYIYKQECNNNNDFYLQRLNDYNHLKKITYISCWTDCQYENMHLWNNYVLNKSNNGIIVQYTLDDIAHKFEEDKNYIFPCLIKYIDTNNSYFGDFNTVKFFSRKPKSFHWEHECRFILQNLNNDIRETNHLFVSVDMSRIKKIILSPNADKNFIESIKQKLVKKNINLKVLEKSKLNLSAFN